MITGPNKPEISSARNIASNGIGKYTAESKAGSTVAIQTTAPTPAPTDNTASTSTTASDVSLSKEAMMMQKLSQAISSYPDVDADRVSEIKREIVNGGFNINSNSIAQKMMLLDSLY